MKAIAFVLAFWACVETIPQGSRGADCPPKDRGRKARYSPTLSERGDNRTAVQNFWRANPALWRQHRKGRRFDGGTQIEAPIFYNTVVAMGSYQDRDNFDITNNQMTVNAVYQLRELYAHVSVSGRDLAKNQGPQAVKSFWKMKQGHVKDGIADTMGTQLQASNAGGKDLDGFGLTLSTSSTYAGLAVADVSVWVAQVQNASANTMTVLNLQGVLGSCTFGSSRPTLILMNQACYNKFSTFGDTVQRIVDTDMASVGIAQLNFRGVPVVVDPHVPGSGSGSTDNVVEFLNEDYLELWTASGWDFKTEACAKLPNEDVQRMNILYKGNEVCHSRRHQGQLAQINPAL